MCPKNLAIKGCPPSFPAVVLINVQLARKCLILVTEYIEGVNILG